METDTTHDAAIAARLRRLEAGAAECAVPFGYDALMERHAIRGARSRRRRRVARASATAFVVALLGASVWRLGSTDPRPEAVVAVPAVEPAVNAQPRMVRAGSYLAVAALEDHIARVDDALNDARVGGDAGAVARLESTRAELMNSYTHVRYAEMLSANL
jgi:hypothetical protein